MHAHVLLYIEYIAHIITRIHVSMYGYIIYYFLIQFNVITRDALNQACGGSGSEVLQASGTITLLLVAICAFIF